ncbi:MAG: aldehyde dehydrogenase family protein [Chloroflexota bacterium]
MAQYSNVINGSMVNSDQSWPVHNPATTELIGHAPISSADQVNAAVAAAKAAQPAWAAKTDAERVEILMKLLEIFTENKQYLAEWIVKEQGKPLAGPGALFEMDAVLGWTQVPLSLEVPVDVVFEDDTRRDEMHRRPFGVVGAITPWNWPLMIAIWAVIPALRMGNTVVIKPSEYTTLGTLEMVRLMNEVLPAGVLNTVSGDGAVGKILVEHKDVAKIMFTGSQATAQKIIESSSGNMARLTLECGGNDAAIMLPDADPKAMAEGLFWGAFINMGQTCACAKRLYVHEDQYEETIGVLKGLAEAMPMGNGMDEGIVLGPIQNEMQFNKVSDLVDDAKSNGARIVTGGEPLDQPGYFYPITIVADIEDGARLVDEEQFGPVLPIIKYSNVEDAIVSANRLDVGLGGSVWSTDIEAATSVASRMEAGTVWVNSHGTIHPMVPFGGVKTSGYGLEFGVEGLKAVSQPQVISINKPQG